MSWAAIAIGVGAAAIGGGVAMGASNKASTPPPRNLTGELGGIQGNYGDYLHMQKDLADYQVNTLYPEMIQQEILGTRRTRQGDLRDVGTLGPGFQQAIGQLNPGWQQGLGQLSSQASTAAQPTLLSMLLNRDALQAGPSDLSQELQSQAMSDLLLGGKLSDSENRDVTQASRAAYSDRGLVNSNPALLSEFLNRDEYSRQRQGERRQFAAGVEGLTQQELQGNRNFQTTVENQNQSGLANLRSFLLSNEQVQQNALSPALGFFGQRTAVNPTAPSSILGAASSGVSSFTDPLLSYGSDLYNTNFNASAAAKIANFNQQKALSSGLISLGGSVAGAGMCWVAREIYGEDNDDWRWFKRWLINESPIWFHNLYCTRGEAFAKWLRRKPLIKMLIKPWFDARVARMKTLEEFSHAI